MGGNLVEVFLGLATAMVGWTLAQLLLTPRLKWSTFVSKRPDGTKRSNYSYRVKLKNASWFRSIAALELHARVYAANLDPARPRTSVSVRFATFPGDVKRLSPRAHTLVYLDVEEVSERTEIRLAEWGHERAAAPDRSLEDLLAMSADAFCSVQVLANDGWTGALHYRESPRYLHGDGHSDISDSPFVTHRQAVDRLYAKARGVSRNVRREWDHSAWVRRSNPELQADLSSRPAEHSESATGPERSRPE